MDDSYQGNSHLTPASASKLCQSLSNVITHWLESLPEDLIPIILSKLPAKSLIKFTSVSTSWISIIKEPRFILKHALNLNNPNATHLFLLHSVHCRLYFSTPTQHWRTEERVQIIGYQEDSCTLLHDDTAVSEYRKIETPLVLDKKLINPCFRVVGTCNGLILLADDFGEYGNTIVIWNPCVRKYVTLPRPRVRLSTYGRYDAALGFGCDVNGDDYKVVRLTDHIQEEYSYDRRCKAQVYSLAKGTWSKVRPLIGCSVIDEFYGNVCVNGVLHWVASVWRDALLYSYYFVLTFDVAGESFGNIKFPMRLELEDKLNLRLAYTGDRKSIALFVMCLNYKVLAVKGESFVDIWVMEEYGNENSWMKLVIIGPQGPERSLPRPICFKRSGELIVELDGRHEIVSLDVVSKKVKHLGISGGGSHELVSLDIVSNEVKHLGMSGGSICSVDSFEESLVLLDRNDATSY